MVFEFFIKAFVFVTVTDKNLYEHESEVFVKKENWKGKRVTYYLNFSATISAPCQLR